LDQLFYSPDTRLKIEQELKKLTKETNPFRKGHISKWGQVREKAETIGEMIKRWNETLADSKLVKDTIDFYKRNFLSELKNLSNKKLFIEGQISLHSKCKLSDNDLSTRSEIGYKNKGYRWGELGKNFSLKDFITYHPETANEHPYNYSILTVYHSFISIETLVEQAPLNELYFLYACEGYAEAKYVAFLKSELSGICEKLDCDDGLNYQLPPVTENLFKLMYVSKFRETEKSLIERGYITCIDGRCEWRSTSDLLGTFIWVLKEKGYFIRSNPEKITVPERSFFKSRYNKDFTQSAKPGFKKTKSFSKKIKEINTNIR
jgi:hypothetical protein